MPMASGSIHVKVSGKLQDHNQQQVGHDGLHETPTSIFVPSFAATCRRVIRPGICCKWNSRRPCGPKTANSSRFRPKTSSAATSADSLMVTI
ncbi:hypothetical protein NXC14_PB00255 (plasmid) [Rhizobium sp. NXC14]|nr:hypothetical protein NXC14_PB00255 [Rhizobium sp. NXC14]